MLHSNEMLNLTLYHKEAIYHNCNQGLEAKFWLLMKYVENCLTNWSKDALKHDVTHILFAE